MLTAENKMWRQDANKYSHILAPASASAKATLPRVAAKLDVNQVPHMQH